LTDTFMVLQGDAHITFDIAKALDAHRKTEADATIILREVLEPWAYGVVVCDSDMRITAFQEKPLKGQEQSNLVSTGIYCLELDVIDLIKSGESDFAHDVFPQLLKEKKRLFGFVSKGAWMDIGSRRGYLEGTKLVLENSNLPDDIVVKENVTIDATACITGPVLIENGVSVGPGSQIGPNVVLKEGVTITEKATIQNSTVLEEAQLGDRSQIQDSIIGEKALLANDVIVSGSIIGPGSELEDFVRIENGSRIWPGIIVHANTLVQGRLVLPTDQPFYFYSDVGKYTGITATSVSELANKIQEVDVKAVEFHLYRRDFERWIREVYQAFELVDRIARLRKEAISGEELQSKLICTIQNWYTEFVELNR
ncbi:MAG: NDP-sugar synthase, partial [Candidatus Bathyarchaeota archaeon]